jgi:hypothetical protein
MVLRKQTIQVAAIQAEAAEFSKISQRSGQKSEVNERLFNNCGL